MYLYPVLLLVHYLGLLTSNALRYPLFLHYIRALHSLYRMEQSVKSREENKYWNRDIQYALCLNTIRKKQGSQATTTILFSYQLHFEIKPVCQYPLQLIYIKGSGHHPSQSEARFLWHFFAIFGEYLYINFRYLTKLGIYV